jgi:hypothetical protein
MKKTTLTLAFLALLAAAPLAGASEPMVKSTRTDFSPDPGKALVIFVRSSFVVGAYSSPVVALDVKTADNKVEDKLVGILSAYSKVAYQANPGENTFLAVAFGGGDGHIARARLEAGRTYYILVKPNWGFVPSFSLMPLLNDPKAEFRVESPELAGWLKSTEFIEPTQAAEGWLNGNRDSVNTKKLAALEKWKTMPDDEKRKLTLLETDARPGAPVPQPAPAAAATPAPQPARQEASETAPQAAPEAPPAQ